MPPRRRAAARASCIQGRFGACPASFSAKYALTVALISLGHAPNLPWMQEARAAALRLGGIPRMNTYSKLYLALLGQFPWKYLPTVPPEMLLFPKWLFFNIYQLSSWTRAMLIPLAILNHFQPTRHLPPEVALHELYPAGSEQADMRPRWRKPRLSWPNFFLCCDRLLKRLRTFQIKPLRKRALRKCESWLLEHIGEGSDGLGAIFPAMLNSILALKALGYTNDHPVLAKAKRDFEGLFVDDPADFRIQPCLSPVWDTAITTIALADSGVPPTHPAIHLAEEWLLLKEVRIRGDWAVKNPHPEASGWAFEYRNDYYPDTDDTMMVLMALRAARPDVDFGVAQFSDRKHAKHAPPTDERTEIYQRALRWLMSFQCKDGGWAAFDKNVTKRWLEDVPFADHNAILDPTCSDLTGRVLELLGKIGFPRNDKRVRSAIALIQRTQDSDGSWYGRWGVNYVYGTWQILRGLRCIGEDMRQPWIVRARDWLESCQNEDGGWGETCTSYDDPNTKGRGPSTPSQTAWALMGPHLRDRRIAPRRIRLQEHPPRRGVSPLAAKCRRLMARTRDDRHRFPVRVLSEIRHVPEQLAAHGPRALRDCHRCAEAGLIATGSGDFQVADWHSKEGGSEVASPQNASRLKPGGNRV